MKIASPLVLDASVILKPVLAEADQSKVKRIFALKENYKISIFVPAIFYFEFLNTLSRVKDNETALQAYRGFMQRQVSVIPFDMDMIKKALKITQKYPKTSFYDAAYHALAKVHKIPLVTADKEYYQKVKAEGDIILLEDLDL